MGRLDLPDRRRDEDSQTRRAGGVYKSLFRDVVESLSHQELVEIADAAYVVANALDALQRRGGLVRAETLRNLADILRVGLRPER